MDKKRTFEFEDEDFKITILKIFGSLKSEK